MFLNRLSWTLHFQTSHLKVHTHTHIQLKSKDRFYYHFTISSTKAANLCTVTKSSCFITITWSGFFRLQLHITRIINRLNMILWEFHSLLFLRLQTGPILYAVTLVPVVLYKGYLYFPFSYSQTERCYHFSSSHLSYLGTIGGLVFLARISS